MTVYKVLSCVSKAMKRKYLKSLIVLLSGGSDDEQAQAMDHVDELYSLYLKKLTPLLKKYDIDIDAYFNKKMGEIDIDIKKLVQKRISQREIVFVVNEEDEIKIDEN